MYIQLYDDLRNLMNDNNSAQARLNAKNFINYALKDIANEYDWEFLRGSTTFTPTANGVYNINPITQLTGLSATLYGIAELSADNGSVVNIFGKYINSTTSAYSSYMATASVSAAVTASASQSYSTIDAFTKVATSGAVYITTGGGNIIATLGATDTYVSNDIRKISAIVDIARDKVVTRYDYNTFVKGSPDESVDSDNLAWDIDYGTNIRVFNLTTSQTHTYKVFYQRKNKLLVNDWDRPEFPEYFYPDIVMYAFEVYGKRYQDEADAVNGSQLYMLKKEMINEIIRKWTSGGDRVSQRILPRGYRAKL